MITTVVNRRWGSYRRLLTGALFEGGEHEIARVKVQRFSIYAVDRHTLVGRDAICILTNRRLINADPSGHMAQTRLESVRSARAHREYDACTGFAYGVVIDHHGSPARDPKGDLYLCCKSQGESGGLVELLLHSIQGMRAATVAQSMGDTARVRRPRDVARFS